MRYTRMTAGIGAAMIAMAGTWAAAQNQRESDVTAPPPAAETVIETDERQLPDVERHPVPGTQEPVRRQANRIDTNREPDYKIVTSRRTSLLVDTRTGDTWILTELDNADERVWLPLRRIRSVDEARQALRDERRTVRREGRERADGSDVLIPEIRREDVREMRRRAEDAVGEILEGVRRARQRVRGTVNEVEREVREVDEPVIEEIQVEEVEIPSIDVDVEVPDVDVEASDADEELLDPEPKP